MKLMLLIMPDDPDDRERRTERTGQVEVPGRTGC